MVKKQEGIRAGGRQFKRLLGQVLIADKPPWSLYLLPVSPCGKYQGIRLYLDVKKAPKNVWFLNRYVGTQKLIGSRDLKILQEFYPGMDEWLKNVLAGKVDEPPVDGSDGRPAKEVLPVRRTEVSPALYEQILSAVEAHWQSGQPLSAAPQTRVVGRYAPAVLSDLLGVPEPVIREIVQDALAKDLLVVSVYDKRTHMRGLQTARMIQLRENGWNAFVAAGLAGPAKKGAANA